MSDQDVDGVLEAIDGALRDLATSPDAMRWTPEPAAAQPEVTHRVVELARECGFTLLPWQEQWLERVYNDLESRHARRYAVNVPRQHSTLVFAFHDEEGHLVVTQDPDQAAAAPGPISIGFDGAR